MNVTFDKLAGADPVPIPPDLVAEIAALTARQRRQIFDYLVEGFFIDTNGVSVAFTPKAPAQGLVRKPAD